MPNQRYGITFPFVDSQEGFFLGLNSFADSEIKSNLIHLILTQKGSRLEQNTFDFTGSREAEYSIRIRIDYSMGDDVFETKDFVIINL